jgi:hypothetical protein
MTRTLCPAQSAPHFSTASTTIASSRQLDDRVGAQSSLAYLWMCRCPCHAAPPALPAASVRQMVIPSRVFHTFLSASSSTVEAVAPFQNPEVATLPVQ